MNVIPRLDTFVLLTLSTSTAAWWAIGERVLGPALLVPATLGSALYPFMAARNVRRSRTWQLAGLMGLAGAAAAATGVLLAPTLVPLVFGRDYTDAVPVVQVMMLVLPIVFASSPMLVSAYSNGAERSIFVPVLLISLLGTLAIVVGQVVAGAEWAAVGFVVRSLLAFLVIATVGGRAAGRLKNGREILTRSPTTAEDLS
jgi:PST family polysaccharide transporter